MCDEASTNFIFNCWCLEIPLENRIRQVPKCVLYHGQKFQSETFYDFYVGSRSRTLGLYSASQHWFEYYFIYGKFVAVESFDLRLSNQYLLVRISPSCFRFAKIFCTGKSPVKVQVGSCTLFTWTRAAETPLREFVPYFLFRIAGNFTLLLAVGRNSNAHTESMKTLLLQNAILSGPERYSHKCVLFLMKEQIPWYHVFLQKYVVQFSLCLISL
jgi:hypothetical protein